MITVHHLKQSRSKRVLWLLEELSMPFELVVHDRDPQTRLAPASLKAIHPLGKAPIIIDENVTLCESGSIMEYILEKDSDNHLRPTKDSPDYYAYLEWLHFAEGSFALPVITTMLLNMETRSGNQALDLYIGKELGLDLGYIESTLSQRRYFAGTKFTAADIMMTVVLEFADNLKLLEDCPEIQAYLKTMQQRDAYQKAAERG